jgi:hypothetical protein
MLYRLILEQLAAPRRAVSVSARSFSAGTDAQRWSARSFRNFAPRRVLE